MYINTLYNKSKNEMSRLEKFMYYLIMLSGYLTIFAYWIDIMIPFVYIFVFFFVCCVVEGEEYFSKYLKSYLEPIKWIQKYFKRG